MKTMKTKLAIGAFAAVMGVSFILPASGMAMRVNSLDDQWGKPAKVEKAENGVETRYYKIAAQPGGMNDFRIFAVQADGTVIDKGFSEGYFSRAWGPTRH